MYSIPCYNKEEKLEPTFLYYFSALNPSKGIALVKITYKNHFQIQVFQNYLKIGLYTYIRKKMTCKHISKLNTRSVMLQQGMTYVCTTNYVDCRQVFTKSQYNLLVSLKFLKCAAANLCNFLANKKYIIYLGI